MPLVEARTLMAYGGFLRRQSEPRRARPHFARALELAEASSAVRLAEEASQELEAAGGRRLRNKHPDELTPQESRVAALAGEGLSNEQIARAMVVSVKTVETHLHHVYDKLGISSRRELIRRATQAPR
jgi:DNA-binding NarL/FixJ family response regulator